MKISRLLVLTALWLGITGTANAGVPEGVWTMPTPTGLDFADPADFQSGEHYILYNPATKMFFASGNGWNTMASLRTFGMEIWLEDATESDAPEGSYRLCDDNSKNPARQTGSGDMFTDDGNSTWVDHGSQANFSWGYEVVGDCVRLQNVALIADKSEFEGMFIGFDGTYVVTDNTANSGDHRDAYTAILRHVDPSAAGVSVDWQLVTVESYEAFAEGDDYEAYAEGAKQYIASMGLKKAIEDAENLWIDVTSATAVYTNTSSTVDEIANATKALNELVDAKQRLQTAINDYKAKGFDGTAPYEAILQNLSATKAQVEQAITDLNAAYVEWAKTQASVENPIDVSTKIVNPTFDNGNATQGWSGDAFGRGGTVADGGEHYSKNYDTYQTITGLSAGVYAVGVNAFYRSGNYGGTAEGHWVAKDEASRYAKFYGKVGETTREIAIANVLSGAQAESQGVGDVEVTYTDADENTVVVYSPNTMAAGDYYFHTLNQYANKLFVAVDEAGELTIGVKKSTHIDGDWSLFDDFSLTYYGNGADACNLYLQESLKNYGEYTLGDDVLYTASYLQAYQEAYSSTSVTASSMEEVNAILKGIEDAKAALDNNIALWKKYVKLLSDAKEMVANDEYKDIDETGDLGDYLDFDAEEILEDVKLTNEELEAEIAKVSDWMKTIEDKSKLDVYEGKVMTKYIKNPGFDDDEDINSGAAEGWTIDRINGGNVVRGPLGQANQDVMIAKLGEQNFCFESWHCHKWDIWQEVTGLPVGLYELQVQGYVRCEVPGYTQGEELGDQFPSPVYLYMNNALSSFPSVYSEQVADEHYDADGNLPVVEGHSWNGAVANYPNSMGAASLCFKWGMYKTKAYGLIAKDGDTFRVGVKMDKDQDWWCIFDSFKLIYHTPDNPDAVKPLLEEAIAKIDLSKPMGKDIYERASQVILDAQAAINANDGAAMFAALNATFDLNAAIIESVALFQDLVAKAESLNEAINESENQDAINEANALYTTVMTGCDNHTITDAEAKEYMEKIDVLFTKLKLPANVNEASDSNPVDVTAVIKSYNFSDVDETTNSSDGWNNPGNLGNDDTQKSVLAMEFWQVGFDMYQTIKGLPEGTYELGVDAWIRNGANQENYDGWKANPEYSMALLYAVAGDSAAVYTTPIANVMAGAQTEDPVLDGVIEATDINNEEGVVYYLPNSLQGGRDYMDLNPEAYYNKAIVKVNADGVLTIGIKKAQEKGNSWVVLDNFKLTYFGKNSSQTVSPDLTGIEAVNGETVKVEYFTLDGRKATKAHKGIMIQKVTLSNGATLIQKIRN